MIEVAGDHGGVGRPMDVRRTPAILTAIVVAAGTTILAHPATAGIVPLTIEKVRTGANPIVAGSDAGTEFTITVANRDDVERVVAVEDPMPTGLVATRVTSPVWNCVITGGSVHCDSALLAAGQTGTIVVEAVAPSTMRPGTVMNCAYATFGAVNAGTAHVGPAQDTCQPSAQEVGPNIFIWPIATASVDVVNDADLAMQASRAAQYGQIDPGAQAVVDFAVRNAGPSAASGPVVVRGALPNGTRFVSGSAPWTCAAVGQDVECAWDEGALLASGSAAPPLSWTVETARTHQAVSYTLSATASSGTADSVVGNNSASTTIGVRKAPRLPQTAKPLPASPVRVKSGRTDQGKKLTTRVLCRPVSASSRGEVAYCKVTRKGDVVRVQVLGSRKVKVTVIQTAKGGDKYKPFVQRKTYIVRP